MDDARHHAEIAPRARWSAVVDNVGEHLLWGLLHDDPAGGNPGQRIVQILQIPDRSRDEGIMYCPLVHVLERFVVDTQSLKKRRHPVSEGHFAIESRGPMLRRSR